MLHFGRGDRRMKFPLETSMRSCSSFPIFCWCVFSGWKIVMTHTIVSKWASHFRALSKLVASANWGRKHNLLFNFSLKHASQSQGSCVCIFYYFCFEHVNRSQFSSKNSLWFAKTLTISCSFTLPNSIFIIINQMIDRCTMRFFKKKFEFQVF